MTGKLPGSRARWDLAEVGPGMNSVSVIVVNWNTCQMLGRALAALERDMEGSAGLDVEILVVDNGSTDGSAELVRRQFPNVRLTANAENVGFARANNQALREAKGELVMLLNSDTEVRNTIPSNHKPSSPISDRKVALSFTSVPVSISTGMSNATIRRPAMPKPGRRARISAPVAASARASQRTFAR